LIAGLQDNALRSEPKARPDHAGHALATQLIDIPARCVLTGLISAQLIRGGIGGHMIREGLKEFQDFILKGNAFDLAVGVIIGAAFGGLVTSLVGDILMPPIGFVLNGIDFSSLFVDLTYLVGYGPEQPSIDAAQKAGHAVIAYGKFINSVINLVIVGFVIFMLVKQLNRFRRKEEAKPEGPSEDVKLLTEIRDLLARDRA
jgi:large conductance mechanosensitive channel